MNLVSLPGLAVALAILLDDAVAVGENIRRHLELGTEPRRAARLGTGEVGGVLAAATIAVLPALLLPVAAGGTTSPWLVPFAVTVAAAALVSSVLSVTLHPVLAVRLLQPREEAGRRVTAWLDRVGDRYDDLLAWALGHRRLTVGVAGAVLLIGAPFGLRDCPFIPTPEDARGAPPVRLELRGADASTLAGVARRIAEGLERIPGTTNVIVGSVTGGGGRDGVVGALTVAAGIAGRAPRAVARDVGAALDTLPLPAGYRLTRAGAALLAVEQARRLLLATGAALLIMYLVLAWRFGSFAAPLAITLSHPIVAAAAAASLLAAGHTGGLAAVTGLLLATGLFVRQSTVLVACARRRRARGDSLRVALVDAGRLRLRPVLLTAAGVALLSVPLLFRGRESASLALTALGGTLGGVVATLLVVPVGVVLVSGGRRNS